MLGSHGPGGLLPVARPNRRAVCRIMGRGMDGARVSRLGEYFPFARVETGREEGELGAAALSKPVVLVTAAVAHQHGLRSWADFRPADLSTGGRCGLGTKARFRTGVALGLLYLPRQGSTAACPFSGPSRALTGRLSVCCAMLPTHQSPSTAHGTPYSPVHVD